MRRASGRIGNEHEVFLGALPEALRVRGDAFENLWNLHPGDRPAIHMHGKYYHSLLPSFFRKRGIFVITIASACSLAHSNR